MPIYSFVSDFSGTVNGQTERHAAGETVEIASEDDFLVAGGFVELADPDYVEVIEDAPEPDALKAPAQRVRRVAKKTAR